MFRIANTILFLKLRRRRQHGVLGPPSPDKLTVTHIRQLPRLGCQLPLHPLVLLIPRRASHKHRRHKMVIRRVRVPIQRVLHQPGHSPPQARAAIIPDDILDRLAELERPRLGRALLGEVVREAQHRHPVVAVEVVHGAAGPDDQVVLLAQRTQRCPQLHVEVRVVALVGRNQRGGRAARREHADKDEVRVVDPVEGGVARGREPGFLEERNAALGCGQIWVELVVDVLAGVYVGYGRLAGVGICGDVNFITRGVPVCSLKAGELR